MGLMIHSSIEDLCLAIADPGLAVGIDADRHLCVTESGTGDTWVFDVPVEELVWRADAMQAEASVAGVGGDEPGMATPGAALLGIHVQEAIATARPGTSHLRLYSGGVKAY